MGLPELIEECKEGQNKEYQKFLNEKYLATGLWFLDELDTEAKDIRIYCAWNEYLVNCKSLLGILAIKSKDPLVYWMATELSNQNTAFNLIKRLPMDLKQIDELAARSKMDCKSYRVYRAQAIEAGVVTEYRVEEVE